jgi:hypothetical protein
LTWSPEWYLVRSTEHKAPRYVVFPTPLLPHASWAQISSSAPYSRKPSAYILPSVSATKFVKIQLRNSSWTNGIIYVCYGFPQMSIVRSMKRCF